MRLKIREEEPSVDTMLRIYINDHRAGAIAGVGVCRRLARRHENTPMGQRLEVMADEIAADRLLLESYAQSHAIRRNPVKQLGAALGERLAASS